MQEAFGGDQRNRSDAALAQGFNIIQQFMNGAQFFGAQGNGRTCGHHRSGGAFGEIDALPRGSARGGLVAFAAWAEAGLKRRGPSSSSPSGIVWAIMPGIFSPAWVRMFFRNSCKAWTDRVPGHRRIHRFLPPYGGVFSAGRYAVPHGESLPGIGLLGRLKGGAEQGIEF